jgi:plastocyanin
MNKRFVMMAAVALVPLSAVLVGCGEPTEADPTPVKTFKITPAATGQVTITPLAATPTPPAPGSPPAGAARLEIAAVSSLYDKEELQAPPGPVTVVLDNRDAGVVHNIHFFRGEDANGEEIAQTDLEAGEVVQELNMDLTPGAYYYQCDAHPTTMKGTLEVS